MKIIWRDMYMNRTHNNGELRISDVNKIVELKGLWNHANRIK